MTEKLNLRELLQKAEGSLYYYGVEKTGEKSIVEVKVETPLMIGRIRTIKAKDGENPNKGIDALIEKDVSLRCLLRGLGANAFLISSPSDSTHSREDFIGKGGRVDYSHKNSGHYIHYALQFYKIQPPPADVEPIPDN